jgi:tetratricopeptide (TPR) repeat protein
MDSSADELDPSDAAAARFADAAAAMDRGALAEARALAAEALEGFRAASGADHPDVGNTLTLLSRIAQTASDYRGALAHADAAVDNLTAARRDYPDEEIVAELQTRAVAQRAAVLHSLGRYDDAEQAVLAILGEIEASDRPDRAAAIATLSNLLGISHKYQARWDDAARRYAHAIELITAAHGPDSAALASLEHNLGGLAHARGEPAQGEPHARRAVVLREAALGPDHPLVAADLAAWAALLDDLGRSDEAEAVYRRALEIFVGAYGEVHYEVGFTLGALGALQAAQERWQEAAASLTRALAVQRQLLDVDHPDLALLHHYLAVVEHGRGDLATARQHADQACAALAARLPAGHPRLADALATRDAIAAARP